MYRIGPHRLRCNFCMSSYLVLSLSIVVVKMHREAHRLYDALRAGFSIVLGRIVSIHFMVNTTYAATRAKLRAVHIDNKVIR